MGMSIVGFRDFYYHFRIMTPVSEGFEGRRIKPAGDTLRFGESRVVDNSTLREQERWILGGGVAVGIGIGSPG
jgi:hypothetical protein